MGCECDGCLWYLIVVVQPDLKNQIIIESFFTAGLDIYVFVRWRFLNLVLSLFCLFCQKLRPLFVEKSCA